VALDEKPKSVPDHELKRVRNIRANPRVAVVIDHYSEDWSELVYVLITGTAEIISSSQNATEHRRAIELLREKYPQYSSMNLDERPIIKITPARVKQWAADDKGGHR
jgi:PPOX class probable F420-dependent enzyme